MITMRKLSAILTGFLAIPGVALWLAFPANAARQAVPGG
jgi:triacylglycerol esterase/lipase EstA (alpha/beta hydrolase family)